MSRRDTVTRSGERWIKSTGIEGSIRVASALVVYSGREWSPISGSGRVSGHMNLVEGAVPTARPCGDLQFLFRTLSLHGISLIDYRTVDAWTSALHHAPLFVHSDLRSLPIQNIRITFLIRLYGASTANVTLRIRFLKQSCNSYKKPITRQQPCSHVLRKILA